MRRADPKIRRRITERVDAICEGRGDAGLSKPLHGQLAGTRSSRLGEIRIILRVVEERVVVVVAKIGPRGDVYRG